MFQIKGKFITYYNSEHKDVQMNNVWVIVKGLLQNQDIIHLSSGQKKIYKLNRWNLNVVSLQSISENNAIFWQYNSDKRNILAA